MIKKIYLNRELPFPIISVVLVITCLIVSLSVFYVSSYDSVLNALSPVTYWWQRFTCLFAHGNIRTIPITVHLPGNLTGLIIFSVLCEKVLIPKKYWLFFLTTLGASVLALYGFQMTGNGISSIVWSFIPISAYILYIIVRWHRPKVNLIPIVIIMIFIVWGVVIYPLVLGNNNMHNMGVLIGVIFTILWRKDIKERLDTILDKRQEIHKIRIYKASLCVLAIPTFVLIIMALTSLGIIDTIKISKIYPQNNSAIEEIIQENNKIEIVFDRDMDKTRCSLLTNSEFDVKPTSKYLNERTLVIEFKADIIGSEYIIIKGDLVSKDGRRYPLKLKYTERTE